MNKWAKRIKELKRRVRIAELRLQVARLRRKIFADELMSNVRRINESFGNIDVILENAENSTMKDISSNILYILGGINDIRSSVYNFIGTLKGSERQKRIKYHVEYDIHHLSDNLTHKLKNYINKNDSGVVDIEEYIDIKKAFKKIEKILIDKGQIV